MPYPRPTLAQLQNQAAQDLSANLPGADALLRFTNLGVLAMIQAGMTHMLYGYLDWIAQQSNPATATDEFLEAWAGLKGVRRNSIDQASGAVSFPAVNGAVLPAGTAINRSDGYAYVTTESALASAGSVVVAVSAVPDPAGLVGAEGNCDTGTAFTLANGVAGITSTGVASTAISGGADLELDSSLRRRMMVAYQTPPQGGAIGDYEGWALNVPGVTRAWCTPNGFGPGTVVVYVMLDVIQAANGGFPVGTDGVAAEEPRGAAATGDQLTVANALFPLRPVTALVYVVAPTKQPLNPNIRGVPVANRAATIAAIQSQMATLAPGGTLAVQSLWQAVSSVVGNTDFAILSPTADVVMSAGSLPVIGTPVWS